jgi:hypothetical protein
MNEVIKLRSSANTDTVEELDLSERIKVKP